MLCSHNATFTHISNSCAPRQILKAYTNSSNLSIFKFFVELVDHLIHEDLNANYYANQIIFLGKTKKYLILHKCVCSYHEAQSLPFFFFAFDMSSC